MVRKTIIFTLIVFLSGLSCQKSAFVQPEFVKVYLFTQENTNNILVLNAFPMEDNSITIFAVKGNVSNKFERVNELFIFRVDEHGNELWRKTYNTLPAGSVEDGEDDSIPYGFPSNIIYDSNSFEVFWSNYEQIYKFNFEDKGAAEAMRLTGKKVSCNFSEYGCGSAFKICLSINENGYLYMSFKQYSESESMSTFVASTELGNENIFGQYYTEYQDLFPNLDVYYPAVQYDMHFWLKKFDNAYYISTPFDQEFAVLALGNQTPIYSDDVYWISSAELYDDKIAAVIVPRNERSEEGLVYFAPQISLTQYNQRFSALQYKTQLPGLSSNEPILVRQMGGNFIVAGTSTSGVIRTFMVSPEGKILKSKIFGSENNYQLNALRVMNDGQHIAIIGTTPVSSQYQRAFFIKVSVDEMLGA